MRLNHNRNLKSKTGLYYKHITIVNYDSSIINNFGASLTDDGRVVIYYCHMFIIQAASVHFMALAK
jgi:hypothetical protein